VPTRVASSPSDRGNCCDNKSRIFTRRAKDSDECYAPGFLWHGEMAIIQLTVNEQQHTVEVDDPSMPLLWVIRDFVGLTGTKYGCGIGQCGACTVHLDGRAVRSCSIPVSSVGKQAITTIEGLSPDGTHPLQLAWQQIDVPQCGYCQAGQLMAAAAFLKQNPSPSDAEITSAMSGNLCRCGTYPRIHRAIKASVISNKLSRS
jgi:isoquinoline 1-oxidoreductase alpha subunit